MCRITQNTEASAFIFWYHDNRMINYDGDRGINVSTEAGKRVWFTFSLFFLFFFSQFFEVVFIQPIHGVHLIFFAHALGEEGVVRGEVGVSWVAHIWVEAIESFDFLTYFDSYGMRRKKTWSHRCLIIRTEIFSAYIKHLFGFLLAGRIASSSYIFVLFSCCRFPLLGIDHIADEQRALGQLYMCSE